jgi:hypothetical protein
MGRGKRQATHKQQTGISLSSQLYSLLANSHLAPFSRTGKMPVPQESSLFVEQASCLFIKSLLRMVQDLS